MSTNSQRTIIVILAGIMFAQPLAAQQGAGAWKGLVMKGAVFFAGRQGRWTVLTAWTILFATDENYGLAMDAAHKAVQIAERSGDDARLATSLRYLAVLYEREAKYADAQSAVQRALALREKSLGADDPAVADQLLELAQLYRKQNKNAQANPLLTRAEHIRERAFGAVSAPVADILIERAGLLNSGHRYSDAEQLYRRAIDIKQKALGPEDPDLAGALAALADSYAEQARYREAESLYTTALQIDEKFMGADDPLVIPTLTSLAAIYEKQGRAAEAAQARQRVARVRDQAFAPVSGSDQQKQWRALVGRSFRLFNANEFSDETSVAQQAMRFAEANFGPEDYRVAAFLVILATQYYSGQAAFTKAEPLMHRAVRIQEKTLGTEDASLTETFFRFGHLYSSEHKDRDAEETLLRAMKIQEHIMDIQVNEDPFMHSPRLSLAGIYRAQERYANAEKLLQDGLRAEEKARGPEPPRDYAMAGLLTGLAYVYEDEGKLVDAAPLLERAITYNGKAWGLGWGYYKHQMVADSLSDLAHLYVRQRKYSDAESAYKRAIKLAGWSANADATGMRWGLAYAYRLDGKFSKAEQLLEKELRFDERNNLSWHMDNTLKDMAWLRMDQGRYSDAEQLLERSLQVEQSSMDPESPFLANTLYDLGLVTFALGRPQQAEPFFQRSFTILSHELQYYFSYMSEADRLRILDTIGYRFPLYFSFVERFHSSDPQLTSRMYDLLLWQRGLVVRSIESLRRKVAASGEAEALALLDELAARRTQLSGLINSGGALSDAGRKKIDILQTQADEVEHKLVARSQAFAEDQKQQGASWQRVRDALCANGADAAVEFVRFPFFDGKQWTEDSHYAALVITPQSETPTLVSLGDASKLEGEPLQQYKAWVAHPQEGEGGHRNSAGPVADAFFAAFWKPLQTALGSAKRVYVAPDGVLNQVSLAVIPVSEERLLSDEYDLRVLNSTADLLRSAPLSRANTAVLIGNPKFNLSEAEQRQAVAALKQPQPSQKMEEVMEASAQITWTTPISRGLHRGEPGDNCAQSDVLPPLPGTQQEVSDVFSMLQDHNWTMEEPYTGRRALEEAVKRVRGPRVLHIATHGFFLSDQRTRGKAKQDSGAATEDPMLRSGLLFAGATRAVCGAPLEETMTMDDGVLTAYEASTLDLQGTELVVLSACETGLGTNRAGEGVFGLRRAFQEAGADSLLISMWQVPDEETRRLMALFYRSWLSGSEKHEALRVAQQELRGELRSKGRDLPFYWGAFVLVGR